MKCYNCNSQLTDADYCVKCGADVTVYKTIVKKSNEYYNLGLAKAQVRDLSGAVVALRTSVRINKLNTKARNLLGLVYFEMGEAVSALSEWVISKNLQPEKNIADSYIKAVQSNPNKLDVINQTIKKYNQALLYAKQGSDDLAVIQLKKVLNLNPNLVKGHQLLALLYIKTEEFDKARKALRKEIAIDRNNTLTLKYIAAVDTRLGADPEDSVSYDRPKRSPGEKKVFKPETTITGSDMIVPRNSYKEPANGLMNVVCILIGLVIGAVLLGALILPARTTALRQQQQQEINELSNDLANKTSELDSLKTQVEQLTTERDNAVATATQYTGETGVLAQYEGILSVANLYISGNVVEAGEQIANLSVDSMPSETAKTLYNTIYQTARTQAFSSLYQTGYDAYNSNDFPVAIDNLLRAYKIDGTGAEVNYYLARSYSKSGDAASAAPYYQYVIDNFPDTQLATYSSQNLGY